MSENVDIEKQLRDSVRNLYITGDYSDFTITCGTEHFAVHKAVFCPRSKVFESMFKHKMKENATNVVKFEEDDLPMVRNMIECLYFLDYKPDCAGIQTREKLADTSLDGPVDSTPQEALEGGDVQVQEPETIGVGIASSEIESAALNALPEAGIVSAYFDVDEDEAEIARLQAKKAVIGKLSKSSRRRLDELVEKMAKYKAKFAADTRLVHHARVYAFGEMYQIPSMKSLALGKFKGECETIELSSITDEFIAAAREVYTSTVDEDRGLRDIVVRAVRGYSRLLDLPDMKQVLRDTQLAYDLLLEAHKSSTIVTEMTTDMVRT